MARAINHDQDVQAVKFVVQKFPRLVWQKMHGKSSDHVCEQCRYVAKDNLTLKRHKASVHKIDDREFKCELCPFKAFSKQQHLQEHVESSHKQDLKCEQTPIKASTMPPLQSSSVVKIIK